MSIFKDPHGDVRPGWYVGGTFSLILVVALVVVWLVMIGPVRWSCRNTAEAMGREWRYSITTQCLVHTSDGRWVPLDSYRLTNEEVR